MASTAPASIVDELPRFAWPEFQDRLYRGTDSRNTGRWAPDEHLTLVGVTGSGKTTMALRLMQLRAASVIFATKPKDATLAGLGQEGWRTIRRWSDRSDADRRLILWPRFTRLADSAAQGRAFHDCLETIFADEGRWAVLLDDLPYLCDELGLRRAISTLYNQARALDMPLVASAQRPRNVPLVALNQATHLFLFQASDEDDLRRIRGLSARLPKSMILQTIPHLPPHVALYLNTRTGDIATVQAPPPPPPRRRRAARPS